MPVLAAHEPVRTTVRTHREGLRAWVCDHRAFCEAAALAWTAACLVAGVH